MKDIYGNELEVGDFVLYTKMSGRSSFRTHRGKVLEIGEKTVTLLIEGRWGSSGTSEVKVYTNIIKVSTLKEL